MLYALFIELEFPLKHCRLKWLQLVCGGVLARYHLATVVVVFERRKDLH